jgi:hypothetical protein
VLQHPVGIGGDDPLGKGRGLCQQKPRPVAQRRAGGHALELVDGGHDVEEGRTGHSLGVVERQAKRHTSAAVMAHDREPIVAAGGHELDELGGHLSLRVALPVRPTGWSSRLPVRAKIGDHYAVAMAKPRRNLTPAQVGLGKAVQQNHGRPVAALGYEVAGLPDGIPALREPR